MTDDEVGIDFSEPTPAAAPSGLSDADVGLGGGLTASTGLSDADVGLSVSDIPKSDQAVRDTGVGAQLSALGGVVDQWARTPSPPWLHNFETAADEMVKGIPGAIGQFVSGAGQAAKFQAGGNIEKQQVIADILKAATVGGAQTAKDLQAPVGSYEWWRGMLMAGQMAAPGLDLLRELRTPKVTPEVPTEIEKPPVQPPPIPPEYETRFQTIPEQPEAAPEIAPVTTPIEETAAAAEAAAPGVRISPETGEEFYPERQTQIGLPSETARVIQEGEEITDAIKSGNAQVEGGGAPLGVETRPGGAVPETGGGDYAVGEAQGEAAGGELPQPVSAGEGVAPGAPQANAPQPIEAELGKPPIQQAPAAAGAVPEGGPSIRAVSTRPVTAPPAGSIRGWEDATKHGDVWLDAGGNINKVVSDFRKTGKVNEAEMGKMNAYLNRLQSVTNAAGDALRKSPSDPALQKAYSQALTREQTFTDEYKPMHTVASASLSALQGKVPLTPQAAASFTGLTRRFAEFRGKTMTPEEVMKAERIASKGEKVNVARDAANGEVYRQMENEYGRIRTSRKGPPTLEEIGKTFGEGLKEVCET